MMNDQLRDHPQGRDGAPGANKNGLRQAIVAVIRMPPRLAQGHNRHHVLGTDKKKANSQMVTHPPAM